MRALAAIKISRAIRRLASATTPGTALGWQRAYLREAIAEARAALDLIGHEEPLPEEEAR